MTHSLYICYFGLREPLVQTQVLPYLREIAGGGVRMSLLTFEPDLHRRWDAGSIAEWRQRLREEGIEWHMLPYHRRPSLPATLWDIAAGAWRAAAIARRERVDIFHGRSHVGATIGALAKRLTPGTRLIFDIRGLLAEEYVDSGNWRAGGLLYRLTKAVERRLLRSADGFVVLTEGAREALFPNGAAQPLEVIPCCTDPERFASAPRAELGLTDRLVFVYAGSLGGYYLVREMAEFLAAAREIDRRVFALVLTQASPEPVTAELERAGFSRDDYRVIKAAPEEVPRYLRAADVGIAFVQPSVARRASSPTKYAEYLAAGLPVVATAGVGDLDAQTERGRVGVLLDRWDKSAYRDAFRTIEELRRDPQLAERCRAEARARYDLREVGGARYRRLYERVIGPLRLRVLALASYPAEAASSRFRVVQFIAPLAERGIEVTFSPLLDAPLFAALYRPWKFVARLPWLAVRTIRQLLAAFRKADIVLVQREAMLFGPPLVEWLATRLRRRPMILDLDDPTWLAYPSPVYGRLATLFKRPRKTDALIRRARVVICGNPNIAAHVASRGGEAVVMPTVVDTRLYRPADAPPNDVPTIGWIGTHGTYPYFEPLRPILARLMREIPFRLVIIGSGRPDLDTRPWRMESEAEDFRSLDIGVYPIANDDWSAGKSGFKAVQYMASGVPFVLSPVGVCATMGVPGQTHLLATSDDEWLDALHRLLTDPELRRRMGRAARAFAERHYSLDGQADALISIIRRAASRT